MYDWCSGSDSCYLYVLMMVIVWGKGDSGGCFYFVLECVLCLILLCFFWFGCIRCRFIMVLWLCCRVWDFFCSVVRFLCCWVVMGLVRVW